MNDELRAALIKLAHENPDLLPALDLKEVLRRKDLTWDECVERFGREGATAIFGGCEDV